MEKAVSTTIQPETILRELAELWVTLGKESDPGQASGVLRACAMTLIAITEEADVIGYPLSRPTGASTGVLQ